MTVISKPAQEEDCLTLMNRVKAKSGFTFKEIFVSAYTCINTSVGNQRIAVSKYNEYIKNGLSKLPKIVKNYCQKICSGERNLPLKPPILLVS